MIHCSSTFYQFFQGFVVAWSGKKKDVSLRLVKHFSKAKEESWKKETEIAKELNGDGEGHPNIIKYCWKARSRKTGAIFPI